MSEALQWDFVTVDDFLRGELESDIKHEYRNGVVYAMAGASNRHNAIAMNLTLSVGAQLRGKPCRPFNSDTKVRIQLPGDIRFYYPDMMVVCDPNPDDETFQDRPVVIVEVVSESTRRVDEGEKRDAYFIIPTLKVYLIVETNSATVQVWRRQANGAFEREVIQGLESTVDLKEEIGANLLLADLFENVDF